MTVLRARRGATGSRYVTLRGGLRRAIPFLLVRSGCGCASTLCGQTVRPACVLPGKKGDPNVQHRDKSACVAIREGFCDPSARSSTRFDALQPPPLNESAPVRYLSLTEITPEQIRAARALLRLEQAARAARAHVSVVTIRRLERGQGSEPVAPGILNGVRKVLEQAGAEFVPDGVRRRTARPTHAPSMRIMRTPRLTSCSGSDRRRRCPTRPRSVCASPRSIVSCKSSSKQKAACSPR